MIVEVKRNVAGAKLFSKLKIKYFYRKIFALRQKQIDLLFLGHSFKEKKRMLGVTFFASDIFKQNLV